MKNWQVLFLVFAAAANTILTIFLLGVVIWQQTQIAQLRSDLKEFVDESGRRAAELCGVVLRLSEIDDSLVTLAGSPDIARVEETYNKILSSQAYCRNSAAVYIDMRGSSLVVRFMETDISAYLRGYWWKGRDATITLLNEEGKELLSFDPSAYIRRGDFMRIWLSPEEPSSAMFYDPATGLSVRIQHLDGSFEPSVFR